MTRASEHDGDGIIGDRPKPKDEDLGPLFAVAAPDDTPGIQAIEGKPVTNNAGDVLGRITSVAEDGTIHGELNEAGVDFVERMQSRGLSVGFNATASPPEGKEQCVECGGRRMVYGGGDGPSLCIGCEGTGWMTKGGSLLEAELAALGPDDNPTDPTKPPAPTKAERMVAIEKIKAAIVDDLVAIADKRRGLPLAQAGVTADDAHALAEKRPESALVGQSGRAWSWLGPWLGSLGRSKVLEPFRVEGIPVTRRSNRDKAHGNSHAVYLHPLDPRSPGQPRAGLATP